MCAELKQSILQKAFSGELTTKPDKVLAEVGLWKKITLRRKEELSPLRLRAIAPLRYF